MAFTSKPPKTPLWLYAVAIAVGFGMGLLWPTGSSAETVWPAFVNAIAGWSHPAIPEIG
jgi:hypothetical protein